MFGVGAWLGGVGGMCLGWRGLVLREFGGGGSLCGHARVCGLSRIVIGRW